MKKFFCLLAITGLLGVVISFQQTSAVYYDPDTNEYVYLEGEEVLDYTTDTEDEQQEEEVVETSAQILSSEYNGPLAYMHEELDEHYATLVNDLDAYFEELGLMFNETVGSINRLNTLECLGVIEPQDDLASSLEKSYDSIRKEMSVIIADNHNDIDALETKIDQELLSNFEEVLQIASLQNRVDTFANEYGNAVGLYYDLSEGSITDAGILLKDASSDKQELLAVYDDRVELYQDLEEAYDHFVSQSSFAGVVVGPNLLDVTKVIDALVVYHTSLFHQRWLEDIVFHIPNYGPGRGIATTQYAFATDAFERDVEGTIDDLIGDLYPIDDLQYVNKTMLNMRSAYTKDNGQYDCVAFVDNATINTVAPELISEMDDILEALTSAANKVQHGGTLPTNKQELIDGLVDGLDTFSNSALSSVIASYKENIRTMMENEGQQMLGISVATTADNQEKIVRAFLQQMYLKRLSTSELDAFIEQLETAKEKLETAMESAPYKTLQTLEVIYKVVNEFLA